MVMFMNIHSCDNILFKGCNLNIPQLCYTAIINMLGVTATVSQNGYTP
jgi:hypothetical protein